MIKFLNEFQKFVFGPFFVHFPSFWGKKRFSRKSGSATIFLAPCQTLEKPDYTIQMLAQTEGWTEGWMEERIGPFLGPFWQLLGVQKVLTM